MGAFTLTGATLSCASFHNVTKIYKPLVVYRFLFVWFDVLWPSQQLWSCRDGQFHRTTLFPGQANQYSVHILAFVTNNNPSWISGRISNDRRNYFMINFHEIMGNHRVHSQMQNKLVHTASLVRIEFRVVLHFAIWAVARDFQQSGVLTCED